MSVINLITAAQIPDISQMHAFLQRVYPPLKSKFLIEHNKWWHQSPNNQWLITVDGVIAGYCGIIPTTIWLNGEAQPALWWVDLVIAPEFRGLGLQSLFDKRLRESQTLLLGFPNALAAAIHKKHKWGARNDMKILLLPLHPLKVKAVLRGSLALKSGALALAPFAAIWRRFLAKQKPLDAARLPTLDSKVLSEIFIISRKKNIQTTWRDEAYFQRRYKSAPGPNEYQYYVAGNSARPSHYLIARHVNQENKLSYTRVLDVFGSLDDISVLVDLLTLAVQDAIMRGSGQVTLLTSNPMLEQAARKVGFFISAPVSFCWHSVSSSVMQSLEKDIYWTLADSDNDAPD